MNTKVLFSSNSDEWSTPQHVFDELNNEFNFTLDPCASKENHKTEKFYTKEDDGISKSWKNEVVFCNPPYSKIKTWVKKSYTEATTNNALVVMLIPARTDTKYFHEFIYNKAEIRFIKGRLKFGDSKNSAPFPSMIVIFRNRSKLEYIGNDIIDVFRCTNCHAFLLDEDCKECPNCHAIFEENNNND